MPAVLVGIIVVLAVVLVTMSFGRPVVEAYVPTPPDPSEAGETLVGPIDYTVDATSTGAWQFFDFSRGSVVADPGPGEWDLAFRRFHIIANGGPGFSGEGGIIRLEETDLDAVSELPDAPYVETRVRRDSVNAAIERWYAYGWTSHLLTPHPAVYAVRTADGRYAKLQLLRILLPGRPARMPDLPLRLPGGGRPLGGDTFGGRRSRESRAGHRGPSPRPRRTMTPDPPTGARDRSRELRRALRERLARGIYERERARDPTRSRRQSSWDDLNAGRRATRLNYADELLTTLAGALGVDWAMVEGLETCAGAALAQGGRDRETAAAGTQELAEVLAALVPRPAGGLGRSRGS